MRRQVLLVPTLLAGLLGSAMAQNTTPIALDGEDLQAIVAVTQELVSHQTVAAIAPPAENAAFQGVAAWLEGWSADHDLEFHIIGAHDAYEIVLPGRSDSPQRSVVLVAHIDVVPVNDPPTFVEPEAAIEGWTRPPFAAVVEGDNLWGRGTEDDKGPIAAALVVLARLRAAGLEPEHDVVIAIGTGEEHAWAGMRRYVEQAPAYEYAISIDSQFPVVVGESGFVRWGLRTPLRGSGAAADGRARAVGVEAGMFHTQVPDSAQLLLAPAEGETAAELAERVGAAAEGIESGDIDPRFEIAVDEQGTESHPGPHVSIEAHGRSVHASRPEDGDNALWHLAELASHLDLAPGGIRTLLDVLFVEFAGDHYGDRLGIAAADDFMGRLSVAATMIRVVGDEVVLTLNLRRPRGQTAEAFRASLGAAVERLCRDHEAVIKPLESSYIGDPHFVDPSGALPTTLLDIYRRVTGDADAAAVSVRGSTYARLFPGAVSFGPSLPGMTYTGHGADEHIALSALALQADVLLEAITRLAGPE